MSIRKLALVGALLALASPASAGYSPNGEVKSSAEVKHKLYAFEVTPPNTVYESQVWHRYTDDAEQRSTIMVMGMRGYDSYALSVMPIASGLASAAAIGQAKFASESYSTVGDDCAMTDLAKPVDLDNRMVAFQAFCIEPGSGQAFELTISWRSMFLAIDELPSYKEQAKKCDAGGYEPVGDECVDRMKDMRSSMRTFVESFRFASRKS